MAFSWFRRATMVLAAGMLLGSAALAQDPPAATASGGEVPVIPTSAFASWGSLASAKLSPDGSKLAFKSIRDGESAILIYNAATQEFVNGIALAEHHDMLWLRWAGNERLLVSLSGTGFNRSRLYAFDIATGVMQPLAIPAMGWEGDDIVHVDPGGEFVLLSLQDGLFRDPDVYRFDLGGDSPPVGVLLESRRNSVGTWLADETGTVRIGIGFSRNGRLALQYRPTVDTPWETISRVAIDDTDRFQYWDFVGLRAGSNSGLSLARPEGRDRLVLQEFDFATATPGRIVHERADADVLSLYLDEARNLLAIDWTGDSPEREWLDPALARLSRNLAGALPGSEVRIIDITPDRSRMLVLQSGAADPGALYIFTPAEGRLDLFRELRPEIDHQHLAPVTPMTYTARDGTSIRAFLALPRDQAGERLPLIVNPHGGPFGVANTLAYNDLVQLLANRGYAVVQPNFRGSGAYGQAFEELGDGQIGRAMQDDLDDLVAHLVAQGIADPDRVCIVGASYGGFAAMWGVLRNPEIYRCAASWAGVTHFDRQLQHDRGYLYRGARGEWRERVEGDDRNFDLDDVSPAVHVARLTRPLLLAHGRKDRTVPFDQFELMQSRAERANVPVETLVLDESSHSFGNPEDEQAWYDRLLAFLEQHNPAGAR